MITCISDGLRKTFSKKLFNLPYSIFQVLHQEGKTFIRILDGFFHKKIKFEEKLERLLDEKRKREIKRRLEEKERRREQERRKEKDRRGEEKKRERQDKIEMEEKKERKGESATEGNF